MSCIVPQTRQYRSPLLAVVSCGLSAEGHHLHPCLKGISCPSANPKIHVKTPLSGSTRCLSTHHMQTHICSVYAHTCSKTTTICICVHRILSTCEHMRKHKRGDHLHLLSSVKMPVEKCHIRFRGGSDVPECMW